MLRLEAGRGKKAQALVSGMPFKPWLEFLLSWQRSSPCGHPEIFFHKRA